MNASDGKIPPAMTNVHSTMTRIQSPKVTKPAAPNPYSQKAATAPSSKETANVTHPAATLELSQEGVQKAKLDQAKEQLAKVKEKITEAPLEDVHSNLRAMRVNHLVLD